PPLHRHPRLHPPPGPHPRPAHRRGARRAPRAERGGAGGAGRRGGDGAMTVALRDVTLRDGLQTEQPVTTADKLAVFDALVAAGVTDLELCSFVRPDRVPAMADAPELAAATAGSGVGRWALVLNPRGAQLA